MSGLQELSEGQSLRSMGSKIAQENNFQVGPQRPCTWAQAPKAKAKVGREMCLTL